MPLNPAHVVLPHLERELTGAHSSRMGQAVRRVVLHRWSDPTATVDAEVHYMSDPAHQVSAHFVYAGEIGKDGGRCVQIVRLADKAWTQCEWNASSVSVECADAMWLGHDPLGLYRLARITGWLLRHFKLTPEWVHGYALIHGTGFCRHADLGYGGCGHLSCPTTDMAVWGWFVHRVQHEVERGGYRTAWAI